MFYQDTFYHTKRLSLKKKKELLEDAKSRCQQWMVDACECWQRVPIKMSWEDIIAKLDKSCHFVFIHRKGYDEHDPEMGSEWFLETGFCTMAKHPEYFLWVNCDQKEIPYFVEKYKLNQML